MAKKKRRDDILDRMIAGFSLRRTLLHPTTLYLGCTVVIIGSTIACWNRYQRYILPEEQFRLTDSNLQITPQPTWSPLNLQDVVLGDEATRKSTPRSVMDLDLIPHTVRSLESIGWIEKIESIRKTKSGLDIDLQYRNPVAMVEISATTVPNYTAAKPMHLHVDRNGVLMGGNLSDQPGEYLVVSVGQPMYTDQLMKWSPWMDPRIQGASKIAEVVKDDWKAMGFFRVMTFRKPSTGSDARIPFQLWTEFGKQFGVHVVWGNPPGEELTNEASAREKLEALRLYVNEFGPFDKMSDRTVDVRSGKVVVLGDYQNAKTDSLQNLR